MARYLMALRFGGKVEFEVEADTAEEALRKGKDVAAEEPLEDDRQYASLKAYRYGPRGGGPRYEDAGSVYGVMVFESHEKTEVG